MTVKQMVPRHTACRTELLIRFYYLTDEHTLLMKGVCPKCKEVVELQIPLTEMYADCPDPPAVITLLDVAYLAQMHITLPEPPLHSA